MKKDSVYRKESLERISSPEQLTDYLKVTSPGIWMLLTAVIALLAGVLVWSCLGSLETVVSGEAEVKDGTAVMLLAGDRRASEIPAGAAFRVGGKEGAVESAGYLSDGRVEVRGVCGLPDGWYGAEIVLDSVHPISFLLH